MTVQQVIGWLKERVARTAHLCLDSRQIVRGDVGVAGGGLADDGRLYIRYAIARAAVEGRKVADRQDFSVGLQGQIVDRHGVAPARSSKTRIDQTRRREARHTAPGIGRE